MLQANGLSPQIFLAFLKSSNIASLEFKASAPIGLPFTTFLQYFKLS